MSNAKADRPRLLLNLRRRRGVSCRRWGADDVRTVRGSIPPRSCTDAALVPYDVDSDATPKRRSLCRYGKIRVGILTRK